MLHPGQELKTTGSRLTSLRNQWRRQCGASRSPDLCFCHTGAAGPALSLSPSFVHITQPTIFTCSPDPLRSYKALSNVRIYRIRSKGFVLGYRRQDLQSAVRARPPVSAGTQRSGGSTCRRQPGHRRRECLTCWNSAAPLAPSPLNPKAGRNVPERTPVLHPTK